MAPTSPSDSTPVSPSARALVLVDGEHYPPVVRAAIADLRAKGYEIVGAVFLGGVEKLAAGEMPDYGVGAVVTGDTPVDALRAGIHGGAPDVVVDLSCSPVVDARSRMLLASHALYLGVAYEGADFRFDPPPRPRVAKKPSIAVVATAKRAGKTAVAAHLARVLTDAGRRVAIVAMGRGGPDEPEVIEIGADLTPAALLALAEAGRHAASDHLEDALTARVPTIGTRRAGGGLAGATIHTTFARGVEIANARAEELLILEGSGAAIPPVHADATVCLVPAHADPELVTGYLGAYVLLLADLVVVTMATEPLDRAADALEDRIRELVPGKPILRTTFRPFPLGSISGLNVFFATTAPPPVAATLAAHLEAEHGARVVGWSANLADRRLLADDLQAAEGAEVVVTELKAAAVDVATRVAIEADKDVVYCDNRPFLTASPDPSSASIADALRNLADLAIDRFSRPSA